MNQESDTPINPSISNTVQDTLVKKAELLMELRGYRKEDVYPSEDAITIEASDPDSEEPVVMHIVTKSNLKSNAVGVEKAREMEQTLQESEVDKIIMFGTRFTKSARQNLREHGIEYFTPEQKIVTDLRLPDLYAAIHDCVDALCQIKCGSVPRSESDCDGYSQEPVLCTFCNGRETVSPSSPSYRRGQCPVCGGTGFKTNHYSCHVRLVSDNADFHYERGWTLLLQNDLETLLTMILDTKSEPKELELTVLSS